MTSIPNSDAVIEANKKAGYSAEKAANTGNQLNADFNFFLKMLTTQLQHQDPSEPMDVSQMTQQITQFSQVEQQVQTNTKLEALLKSNATMTQQSQLSTAAGYIGREIETPGSSGQVYGGQGAFTYVLPENAGEAEIVIKNAEGAIVFQGAASRNKGRNIMLWDGINSSTNKQEPDGIYSMTVTAKSHAGEALKVEPRATWLVGGFETDTDGNILLNVDKVTVKYTDVMTVRPATRAVFEYPDDEEDTVTGGNDTGGTEEPEESEAA